MIICIHHLISLSLSLTHTHTHTKQKWIMGRGVRDKSIQEVEGEEAGCTNTFFSSHSIKQQGWSFSSTLMILHRIHSFFRKLLLSSQLQAPLLDGKYQKVQQGSFMTCRYWGFDFHKKIIGTHWAIYQDIVINSVYLEFLQLTLTHAV